MRIAPSELQPKRRAERTETVILFLVGREFFAIAAHAVHEVRSTDSLSGVASEVALEAMPQVGHRIRRGHKFYYVINACAHFGLAPVRPSLVLVFRDSRVALLVDRIDRMESISHLMALPPSFRGGERQWYRGLTLIGDSVVPVVRPSGFLTEAQLDQLDAVVGAERSPVPDALRPGDKAHDESEGAASS